MSERQLRIGDAEREVAAAALGEHFAQGRLTLDEHAERLDQVWAARTRGDLEPVFRDLPGRPGRPAPRTAGPGRRGRPGWPVPLLPLVALLVVLTVLTHLPLLLIGLLTGWLFLARRHRWTPRC